MKKDLVNYETLLKITKSISQSKDPKKVALMTVKSITTALDTKGCSLFLINPENNELQLETSYGLSDEYINNKPVSVLRSKAQFLEEGPMAIYDVMDDPRIKDPDKLQKEGIASLLSVPIVVGGDLIGAMRVYTSDSCEFTLEDVNFVQSLAQLAGMAINMARFATGLKSCIDVLKSYS